MVAENTVLKINPSKIGSIQPPSKVLFSHNSSEEILGLSISPSYLSFFITVRNRGIFSFLLRGELQWSIGPTLRHLRYTQGSMVDQLNCYFNSSPVVDLCEGILYVRYYLPWISRLHNFLSLHCGIDMVWYYLSLWEVITYN